MNDSTEQEQAMARMPQATPIAHVTSPMGEKEVNLLDMWRVVVEGKWLVIAITLLCAGGAVAAAFFMTPVYRAEVLVKIVVNEKEAGGLASLRGQFGGLASLAGIGASVGNSKDAALATLESRAFVKGFLGDHNLLPVLYDAFWDGKRKDWEVDDPDDIPTMWDAVTFFRKNVLKVSEDKTTGLVTLAIEWKDRELAKRWANELVARANRHLRNLAIGDAQRSIEYLNNEAAKAQVVELKDAITSLLEDQIKQVMLANVRDEFAFKTIDPAVVMPADEFVRPKRLLIIVFGIMVGGFLGISTALVRKQKDKAV